MSVYRPKRKTEASKFYICEFVIQGKRIQESTGTTSKTVAKEYEKRRAAPNWSARQWACRPNRRPIASARLRR